MESTVELFSIEAAHDDLILIMKMLFYAFLCPTDKWLVALLMITFKDKAFLVMGAYEFFDIFFEMSE